MRQGRIEQQGRPGDLYERPRTRFVADFLGKSNFVSGRALRREADALVYEAGGLTLRQALDAEAGVQTAAGSPLTVALRPEKIEIAPAGSGMAVDNRLSGRIAAVNYYGASFQFRVETPALGDLLISAPAWSCRVRPTVNAEIGVGWRADASILVSEDAPTE